MSSFSLPQTALILCAVLALFAIVCRLLAMTIWTHKPAFIIMHMGMAASCVMTIHAAVQQAMIFEGVLSLSGVAAWLVVSYPSWRDGPPAHTLRKATA